jgi:chromosome segregation ATPase
MEDMSKKGKRLEKENEALKRQKEATAANIIRMAEERQDWKKKIEAAETKTEKLKSIIQQMQQQGRNVPPNLVSTVDTYTGGGQGGPSRGDDSEYSEGADEEEEEELSEFDDDDDDDDTEEEPQPSEQGAPVTYGPERPPQPAQATTATTNGH